MTETPAAWQADTLIDPAFFDIDPMEIVWHGNYVKYLEVARCTLLDQIDYNYYQMKDSGYAWPIVDLHLRYVQPVRFRQKIRINAKIIEWEHRLKIHYRICDDASGRKLTTGHTVQVAVDIRNGELQFETPPVLRRKLGLA
ncbi:MAG: acyl-CoA thioesterase [Rhodanobacteraceae bacterium]|nr:acyl-CoA thioesterase [Rhodanobacteraceae bacterium]